MNRGRGKASTSKVDNEKEDDTECPGEENCLEKQDEADNFIEEEAEILETSRNIHSFTCRT